jgi:nicotinamidase-related amidase
MSTGAIYLVCDRENGLIAEGMPFAAEAQRSNVIANTKRAVEKARAAGAKVGYVRVGFSSDYRECPMDSPVFSGAAANGMLKLGTWDTEVVPEIAPQAGDFDIVKHRVGPFYGTHLDPILRANKIHKIYISGVSTNGVVNLGTREGHDRDFEMAVVEDCCSAGSQQEHEEVIRHLSRYAAITTSLDADFR